jgi:hypothetical protein
MTAAVLQGAPVTTLDADFWIDLPERRYIRVLTLCQKLGAKILANTVVVLEDETRVDFLYRVDGLASFATEWRRSITMEWMDMKVKVLPLDRVIRSKEFVGREKDLAVLPVLKSTLAALRAKGSAA